MSNAPHNGNGGGSGEYKRDADIAALEDGLIEQGMALQRILDQHEKSEKRLADELVSKVSSAVAIVLEHRLVPLERKVEKLCDVVAELSMQVQLLLRRV